MGQFGFLMSMVLLRRTCLTFHDCESGKNIVASFSFNLGTRKIQQDNEVY